MALTSDVADVVEQMAHVALVAALQTSQDAPDLRVVPEPDRWVVLVAGHNEAPMVSPIGFTLGVLPLSAPGHRAPGDSIMVGHEGSIPVGTAPGN